MLKYVLAWAVASLVGWGGMMSNGHAAERIFYDGFEHGLDQWVLGDSSLHRQSQTFARTGIFSHKVQTSGSSGEIAAVDFDNPPTRKLYLSFWWLLNNAPDTGGKLGALIAPGTGNQMEILWTNGGHDIAVNHNAATSNRPECNTGTDRVYSAHTAVFDNDWHHFEMLIEYNTPGIDNGRLRVWIDRPQKASYEDRRWLKADMDGVLLIDDGPCEEYFSVLRLPVDLDERMQPGFLFFDAVELWNDLPAISIKTPGAPTNLRVIE